MFQAIICESVSIVASGLASAEDVDTAISCGMAMRFPEWGPLKHLDAIGLNLGAKTGKGFYDWTKRNIDEDMQSVTGLLSKQ